MSSTKKSFNISCPTPSTDSGSIKLGHGSGGRMTDQLIDQFFMPIFDNPILKLKEDASVVPAHFQQLAFTTDSYVVTPVIFPGGNIGSLAVHGTVNDLCMRGAKPLYLSAAFIIEEGFSKDLLLQIVKSFQNACLESGIQLIAADTKVVNKGCADQIFITTSGVGAIITENIPSVRRALPGDVILCSGDLGRHGMAIMSARENLEIESSIESDSAPLNVLVERLGEIGTSLHVLRDVTRGGLAGVLNEIALASNVGIEISEAEIKVNSEVRAACEILGLDPLYVACEGRLVAIVDAGCEQLALQLMQQSPYGESATKIGKVVETYPGRVAMQSLVGGRRIVDKLAGEQLPRIC